VSLKIHPKKLFLRICIRLPKVLISPKRSDWLSLAIEA